MDSLLATNKRRDGLGEALALALGNRELLGRRLTRTVAVGDGGGTPSRATDDLAEVAELLVDESAKARWKDLGVKSVRWCRTRDVGWN